MTTQATRLRQETPPMVGGRVKRSVCHHRKVPAARPTAGFTLVELLVTISVISILIGILIPAIAATRGAARDAACLGNHRQFGVAWNSYLVDNIYVPYVRKDRGVEHVKDWGGVDWYSEVTNQNLPTVDRYWNERPLNAYLGAEVHQTTSHNAFLCPADHGLLYRDREARTASYWSDDEAQRVSTSELNDDTIYGVRGTSYTSNDWLWVKPGSYNGFGDRIDGREPTDPFRYANFTNRNQLSTVSSPSLLVLVSDADDAEAWRVNSGFRHWSSSDSRPAGMPFGAWHGYGRTNAAFLDGSARNITVKEDQGATADYSFWLQPELHGPGSATIASKPRFSVVPGGDD